MSKILTAIGEGALGLMLQKHNDKRQLEQQGKLGQQQLGLDIQKMAAQKQMDLQMWKDTNYAAQKEEIEKAGLNPALLYGMSGGGGTTTGNSGGSVNTSAAPAGGGEIMGMMMQKAQLDLINAQTDATKADAELKRTDAAYKGGVQTDLSKKQIESLTQGIENQKAVKELTNIQSRIANLQGDLLADTFEEQVQTIGLQKQIANEEFRKMVRENWLDQETAKNRIKIVEGQLFNVWADTALKKANKGLTEQQTAESKARVQQAWQTVSQGWGNLTVNQGNMDANTKNAMVNDLRLKFEKEIKDVADSTKLTVESVLEVLGMILGTMPKTIIKK